MDDASEQEKNLPVNKSISFVSSYGFFWKREFVDWSKTYETAKLLGARSNKRNPSKKEITNLAKQVGVYALYNDNHDLVYFGQVGYAKYRSIFQRLKEHCGDGLDTRWSQFSWFGVTKVNKTNELSQQKKAFCQGPTEAFIDQLEAIVIAISDPPSNKKGGSFKGANKFYQVRDSAAGKTLKEMVNEIHEKSENTLNK